MIGSVVVDILPRICGLSRQVISHASGLSRQVSLYYLPGCSGCRLAGLLVEGLLPDSDRPSDGGEHGIGGDLFIGLLRPDIPLLLESGTRSGEQKGDLIMSLKSEPYYFFLLPRSTQSGQVCGVV